MYHHVLVHKYILQTEVDPLWVEFSILLDLSFISTYYRWRKDPFSYYDTSTRGSSLSTFSFLSKLSQVSSFQEVRGSNLKQVVYIIFWACKPMYGDNKLSARSNAPATFSCNSKCSTRRTVDVNPTHQSHCVDTIFFRLSSECSSRTSHQINSSPQVTTSIPTHTTLINTRNQSIEGKKVLHVTKCNIIKTI